MKTLLGFTLSALLIASATAQADKATDIAAIEQTVYHYFEGNGTADRKLLSKAFAEEAATMVGAVKNDAGKTELKVWKDMSAVLDTWASNKNPGGAGRDGEIVSLSVVEGRLATVIFRYTNQFYDAFSLVKLDDGSWKIASKTYIEQ